jgi:phosphoribosyl-AMP cyclohydrolase
MSQPFTPRGTPQDIERGAVFQPAFTNEGLIPAIVTDAGTGAVLMFAWMDAEALRLTIETRTAHFFSRSRGKLWIKGEESGNVLHVIEMATDCDQDVVSLKVAVRGQGVACHTGQRSCFYRTLALGPFASSAVKLTPVAQPVLAQPVVK